MDAVAYTAALFLAATFAVAAAAKVRAPRTTAASFAAFRLPASGALARIVPAVELLVAAALVAVPRAGGVFAVVLLVAFTAVVARAVARRDDVTCGCFGVRSTEPVGPVTVARNALLAGAAVIATTATAPRWPGVAALVTVTGAAGASAVLLALAGLHRSAGRVWSTALEDVT